MSGLTGTTTPLTAVHAPRGPAPGAVLGVRGGCHSTLTNALRGENTNRPHSKHAEMRSEGLRTWPKATQGRGRTWIWETAPSKRHGSKSGGPARSRDKGPELRTPRGRAGSHSRRQTGRAALMGQVPCSRGREGTHHTRVSPHGGTHRSRRQAPTERDGPSPSQPGQVSDSLLKPPWGPQRP